MKLVVVYLDRRHLPATKERRIRKLKELREKTYETKTTEESFFSRA